MKWFGERPLGFSNWADGPSSSDLVPLDTCVTLHSDTGKWENVSCLKDAEHGVVCETNQSKIEVFFLLQLITRAARIHCIP